MLSKAARKASWARSSAVAGSAPMRRISPRTAAPWRRTSSPKALRSPAAARPASSTSWRPARFRGIGDADMACAPLKPDQVSDPVLLVVHQSHHLEGEADEAGDGADGGDRKHLVGPD